METFWDQTAIFPTNYFGQTTIDPAQITSIINSMTIDIGLAKEAIALELNNKRLVDFPIGYDLKLFRDTPLVRLLDGRLVCMSLQCLFEKSTQNAIWMAVRGSTGTTRQGLIHHLTHYRGLLFEEYLKELCSIMIEKNENLSFTHIPPEATTDNEEVGDSILIQDKKLIIFEAKSRQFLENFKTTGDWEKDPDFINTFIKAAKQIEIATNKIRGGQVLEVNIHPQEIEKIYPVIVTYETVPMHGKLQRFMRQKIIEAGFLTDSIFAPVEIITISDIESSLDSTETITLIQLLEKKNSSNEHASESTLHNFTSQYMRLNTVISTGWQAQQIHQTWENLLIPYFRDRFIT